MQKLRVTNFSSVSSLKQIWWCDRMHKNSCPLSPKFIAVNITFFLIIHKEQISVLVFPNWPMPVAAQCKACVCDRSLARWDYGFESWRGMDVCFVCVVCCQVEIFAPGWSLVQRSPTECGASNHCDRQAPQGETMTRNGSRRHKKK